MWNTRFDVTFINYQHEDPSPLLAIIEAALFRCYNVRLPGLLIEYVTSTRRGHDMDVIGTRLPYLWANMECLEQFVRHLSIECQLNYRWIPRLTRPLRLGVLHGPNTPAESPHEAVPPSLAYNLRTVDGQRRFFVSTASEIRQISSKRLVQVPISAPTSGNRDIMQKLCLALSPSCTVDAFGHIANRICKLLGQPIDCCYLPHRDGPWIIFQLAVPAEIHHDHISLIAPHCPPAWEIDATQPAAVPLGKPSACWTENAVVPFSNDFGKWPIIMDLEDLPQLGELPQLEFLALWTGRPHSIRPAPPNIAQLVTAHLGGNTRYDSYNHSLPGCPKSCYCPNGPARMYATFGATMWIVRCRYCHYVSRYKYAMPQLPVPPPPVPLPPAPPLLLPVQLLPPVPAPLPPVPAPLLRTVLQPRSLHMPQPSRQTFPVFI